MWLGYFRPTERPAITISSVTSYHWCSYHNDEYLRYNRLQGYQVSVEIPAQKTSRNQPKPSPTCWFLCRLLPQLQKQWVRCCALKFVRSKHTKQLARRCGPLSLSTATKYRFPLLSDHVRRHSSSKPTSCDTAWYTGWLHFLD